MEKAKKATTTKKVAITSRINLKTAPQDYTNGDYTVKTKNSKIFGDNVEKLSNIKGNKAAKVTLTTKYVTTTVEKNGALYIVTKFRIDVKTGREVTVLDRYSVTEFEYNYKHFI